MANLVSAQRVPEVRTSSSTKRRNLELILLFGVAIVTLVATVLVQLGVKEALDPSFIMLSMLVPFSSILLHVCLRFFAPQADPFLLPVATFLTSLGIAEIYRIDLHVKDTGWEADSIRQIAWAHIALFGAFCVILLIRNHRILQRYTYIFGVLGILLLLLPLFPVIGKEVYGARVWIQLGSFSFQPGELAKLSLAVFFAGYLVQTRDSLSHAGKKLFGIRFPRGRDLGPIFAVWVFSMIVIVFQRDLGTSLLIFSLFLVMIYVATAQISWLVIGGSLLAIGATASQMLSYVNNRFQNWINPFDADMYERIGGSYQLLQGIFGLAHGGLLGTGLGRGQPWLTPLSQSDYIIASLGEELGLSGLFAIFMLYLIIISRGLRIGLSGQDDFGKLLAVGLSFTVAIQCFLIIGGITRVVPLTGLTTPFLTAGGSSLISNWIIVALLLRLSDTVRSRSQLVVN